MQKRNELLGKFFVFRCRCYRGGTFHGMDCPKGDAKIMKWRPIKNLKECRIEGCQHVLFLQRLHVDDVTLDFPEVGLYSKELSEWSMCEERGYMTTKKIKETFIAFMLIEPYEEEGAC